MDLASFFGEHNKVAIAFSGGVDSAYLLYAAKTFEADVTAYYVKTSFQPKFEYEDAVRLAQELSVKMKVISFNILTEESISSNPANRCYFCKQRIFQAIREQALLDGYSVLLDGTNASDEEGDRPGMRALRELSVLSPLRICGLTKAKVRELSKEAGLFTWDKPAYACLATRVKTGEVITEETLKQVEQAESSLMSLGFRDFRVRVSGGVATLQIQKTQFERYDELHKEVDHVLRQYFQSYVFDEKGRG